jgi:hypothetical protein
VTISSSQESCDYTPHVQVFKSKDTLTVLNKDDLLHHVHIVEGEKTILNVAQSPGAAYKKKTGASHHGYTS